jgi:hypothetical protein
VEIPVNINAVGHFFAIVRPVSYQHGHSSLIFQYHHTHKDVLVFGAWYHTWRPGAIRMSLALVTRKQAHANA